MFTEAMIFSHFNTDCHIPIETNASGYAIGGIVNYMTSETS